MFNPEAIPLRTLVVNESKAVDGWLGSKVWNVIPAGSCSNVPGSADITGAFPCPVSSSPTYELPSGETKKPILLAATLELVSSLIRYPFSILILAIEVAIGDTPLVCSGLSLK